MDKILVNLSSVSISFPPISFTTVQIRSSLIALLYDSIPSQSIKIRQNHSQKFILKIVKYAKKTAGRIVSVSTTEYDSSDSFYIFDLIHTNLCYCAMFLHIQSLFFTLLSVIARSRPFYPPFLKRAIASLTSSAKISTTSAFFVLYRMIPISSNVCPAI